MCRCAHVRGDKLTERLYVGIELTIFVTTVTERLYVGIELTIFVTTVTERLYVGIELTIFMTTVMVVIEEITKRRKMLPTRTMIVLID